MEDLAWQFPAEPVERAALRFCEAMARWRGKPELETVRRLVSSLSVISDQYSTRDGLRYPSIQAKHILIGILCYRVLVHSRVTGIRAREGLRMMDDQDPQRESVYL